MTVAAELIGPEQAWTAWTFDPLVWASLATGGWLYARGRRELWRGEAGRRAIPRWRGWCFLGALAVAALALLSPVDALAATLVSAHMAQHLLLAFVAAPLLVLARPVLVVTMGLGPALRRRLQRLRLPGSPTRANLVLWAAVAVVVHSAGWWAWHVPALYRLALRHEVVHIAEHASMLGGGALLWWLVADARGRHANAIGVLAMFAAMLSASLLAGLITFTGRAWFAVHEPGAALWGLTALEDQHLAGGMMWFPGALAYIVGGCAVFLRWLRNDEALWDSAPAPVEPV